VAARLARGLAAALSVSFALAAAALTGAGPAEAADDGPPLPGGRVQLPPVMHFFVVPLERSRQPPPGGLVASLDVAYSNILQLELARGGRNRFEADLELLTVTPKLAWRPADRLDLALALPLHLPGSGFLDRAIEGYHDLLGLDDDARDVLPHDEFASRLVVDDRLVYQGEQRAGVGDLAFTQGWRLAGGADRPFALSLRTGVEAPTGDAGRGFGSGEVDLGAALAASVRGRGVALHGQVTWSLPGDLAGESRVETRAAYGFGLAAEVSLMRDRLAALAQVDGRTPFASGTGLIVLDDPLLQATFGLGLRVGKAWVTVGVAEDVRTGVSPDVTFLIRLSPRVH
jgi:hypothetical protein